MGSTPIQNAMRLAEDDDSWKAGGIIRRDFRAARDGPEVPRGGTNKSKRKNLKLWCRGKVGQEHAWKAVDAESRPWYHAALKCSRCGKLKWR